MGRKRSRKKNKEPLHERVGIERETIYGVVAVAFFVLGVFFVLSGFGLAGPVGRFLFGALSKLLGVGYGLIPALAFVLGASYLRHERVQFALAKIFGGLLFVLAGLGIVSMIASERGGLLGGWIAHPLESSLDVYASIAVLAALFIISLLIIFNARFSFSWFRRKDAEDEYDIEGDFDALEEEEFEDGEMEDEEVPKKRGLLGGVLKDTKKKERAALADEETLAVNLTGDDAYTPPPLSILQKDRGKPGVGDIKAQANLIKRTFQNFGIDVEMDEISVGPTVTRYALKPAEGVRLSKILGLQKNLELALAAHPVRIEAPIPGRSLVGIEVPNTAKTTVGLGALLTNDEFQNTAAALLMALGKNVSGGVHFARLAKMPHMLIAGATGAGKSVTIHALIASLLYRHGPSELKFVMIDPKRVELTLYNGIPHLLTPVITDPKKAILALKWLTGEMERRYNVLEENSARDVQSYHANILAPALERAGDNDGPDRMPYIIVVIDELADIMSSYPRELEAAIVRLAQMSRAVGIHLILSTQRPSVNVITGLIKANVPARVALQVSSQVDSRTILDAAGAEKLLGAGDMLFLSGEMAKPVRLQSAFISEEEVKKIVKHLKRQRDDDDESDLEIAIADADSTLSGDGFDDDDDDLYEDARETVIRAGKASTSYLQRKLRVGYSRAARLMDILEERGVIGPADGSKPREVLVDAPDATDDDLLDDDS